MGRLSLACLPAIALALLVAPGCRGPSATKEQLLETGNKFAAEHKYQDAILAYRNAIQIDEKFGQAHARLADVYLRSNDGYHALIESVRAADLLDDDNAQLAAGRLLILARRFADATERAEKVLAKNPRNVEAQLLKGNAMLGIADVDAAIKDIQEAIAIDPKSARSYAALGVVRAKQGHHDEAERAFKQAVEADPSSFVAQTALGHYYWATGKIPEAEAPLKRAVEIAPDSVLAQRALITYYLATGRLKDAQAPLKLMADTVKTVEARLALADFYLKTGSPDDAVKVLKSLAQQKDGFADATVRLASVDYQRNRQTEAKAELDSVLAQQPTHVDALMLKARFLAAEGNLDDAIVRAKEATAVGKRASADAYYLLGILYAARNRIDDAQTAFQEVIKLNPKVLDARLQLAQLQLQKSDPQMAVQYAQEAASLAPQDLSARLMLGRVLTAQGDVAHAEGVLKALAADAPDVSAAHAALGDLLLLKNDAAAARREYDRAIALDSASLEALRGQISADIAQRNPTRAMATIDDRLRKSPKEVALLLLASQTYAAAGDQKRQEEALRRIIDVEPGNLSAFASLGALYIQQGRLEEARAEYLKLAGEQPSSITAPTMIALILEAEHKTVDAERAYERVLADHPKAPVAANNLAWLYAEHDGNLDVALQLAQSAKQYLPTTPEVDDTIGWIYYKKDLATLAVPSLEAAVRTSPKNAAFQYHLGMAYSKAGERAKAKQALNEALKLKPDFREASDAAIALGVRD